MSVNNSLTQRNAMPDKPVEYKCGEETVKLSPSIIRSYLVKGGGDVQNEEIELFIRMCQYQRLNPFIGDAHLIKYGRSPATMVVGKDALLKRAMRNPKFEGYEAGVVIIKKGSDPLEFEFRTGALAIGNEQLVGGWAKVYVKGYRCPIEMTVTYREYVGKKGDGTVNQQWQTKPATMLRKVALAQALREAFPDDLGGLYDQSEVGVEIDEVPVPVEIEETPEQQVDPVPQEAPAEVMDQRTMEELPDF